MKFVLLADRVEAIPIIARWYFDEWGHRVEGNSFDQTCDRIRGKLNRDRVPLHLLAVETKQTLGVAQLKIREMDIYPEKEYWLGGVFVRPEARGRGVASGLVAKIVEIAQSLNVKRLYLQTQRLDGGLYARLGWKAIEQVNYKGLDVVVMERELDG